MAERVILGWDCPCGNRNRPGSTCQQCGRSVTEGRYIFSGTDEPPLLSFWGQPTIWLEGLLSLLIPFYGLCRGFILAFDPDPEIRRVAGYCFAGWILSLVLSSYLYINGFFLHHR
jgi:hypothetical protein